MEGAITVLNISRTQPTAKARLHKKQLDRKMREQLPHMTDWVQHDLRRTWRSLMRVLGVTDAIAERTYRLADLGGAVPGQ